MDWQYIADGLFIISGIVLGALYKELQANIKEMEQDTMKLADKVNGIEVLIAGNYIKREEFEKLADALFRKLDIISDKIDKKADK